ncbi:MAG: rhodanese-like domain-containing protein [Saprospiraceae bacterium]|nr:rhodanese-like domain-containing protein [Saprospiraceae bacterium]
MNPVEISVEEAQDWLKEGHSILVDVREKEEVDALGYAVENQLQIPLSEFEMRCSEIPKDSKVIMACRSGARSMRATYYLLQNGWDKELVANLGGGMIAWSQSQYPVNGYQSGK